MKFYFLLAFFVLGTGLIAQEIHHEVSMPNPETHYFHVQTSLTNFSEEELTITMPVWAPGSYLVREYPKHVNHVIAKDEKGNQLPVQKVRKNQWKITKGKAKNAVVTYQVYAFDLTVRTSFLDKTHGYMNGTSIFTYPEGYLHQGGKVTIVPHASFKKITTPLPEQADGVASDGGAKTFVFEDFHELADTPFEVGNQKTFTFDAAGVKHHVAIYGEGNYNIEELKENMPKIVEVETEMWGENPNKEYWIIVHNVDVGNGGLEHKNSTTLSVNRWTYSPDRINDFYSVFAHEYFHVWNVKRLRPSTLVEYDYSNENYTEMLWLMEGFTSYYSDVFLRRAGLLSAAEFVQQYSSKLNWIENLPGNKVQSLEDASFDAWIKAYRPDENSQNTTVSYYSKGGLLGGILDAMIIQETKGKKSLDDLLRTLYTKYYKQENVGVTTEIFQQELDALTGKKSKEFFDKYVAGTETLPYKTYLEPLGVSVVKTEQETNGMGWTLSEDEGKLLIQRITVGSVAEKVGLSPNDEVVAYNGFRANKRELTNFLAHLAVGDEFNLIVARDKKLMSIDAEMGVEKKVKYRLTYTPNKWGDLWTREMDL